MKSTAIAILIFFSSSTIISAAVKNDVNVNTNGSSSSVNVNIENEINTESNTRSYTSSTSETSVYINQEGEGTSSIRINGEKWSLDGPGEIEVNKDADSSAVSPTTVEPTEEPIPSPTETDDLDKNDDQEEQVLGTNDETNGLLERFFETIRSLFEGLFS